MSSMKASLSKIRPVCYFLLAALFIGVILATFLYQRNKKLNFVKNMANGINLGNTLDATRLRDYIPDASELDYETFWHNPKITQLQLAVIRKAGFRTVRIPVTFEDHLDEEFQISDIWMNRVKEVIHMAIEEDLYVIMDLHGDEWMDLQLSRKEEIKRNFETVWTQIAEELKDCDEHLLFEGMNEPRLRDSEYEWTEGTEELRSFVNELNELFVEAVRKTGGNNKERYLLICPYCNGPWEQTVNDLAIPSGNIIVAVHMYRPYRFCQDEYGTDQWDRTSYDDTHEAEEAFRLMYESCVKKKIPVIFTEYGCIDKNNLSERMEWASFYTELSKKYQIPCIWWDNGSTYQLMDRDGLTWKYPEIVDIITRTF